MRLVFATLLAAAVSALAGCDAFTNGGTAVRVTVTVDGRLAAGADAQLLARNPANMLEAYTETIARGGSRSDGRVTLLVLDDGDVPGAAFGYRLLVSPPAGVSCNRRVFEAVEPGTDTSVTAALAECSVRPQRGG